MADQKITALSAETAPASTDLVVIVKDPGGSPVNRKVTLADLLNGTAARRFIKEGLSEEYDRTPTTTQTEDDEFNAGSLDGKWTATTNTVDAVDFNTTWKSHLYARVSSGGSYIIEQAYAPAGDFTLAFCGRLASPAANSAFLSLECITVDNANRMRLLLTSNTQMQARLDSFESSTYTNRASSNFFPNNYFSMKVYGYLERVSNVWRGAMSYDGLTWIRTATHSKTMTVTKFQLGASHAAATWGQLGFDWVRRDWFTLP